MTQKTHKYDLEERTSKFGEEIIRLGYQIEKDIVTRPIISQLIRSATSVGANYMEANNASSKKDFRNKIYIVRKELQETKYWLRMLDSTPVIKSTSPLLQECQELIFIFQKITTTIDRNEKLKIALEN